MQIFVTVQLNSLQNLGGRVLLQSSGDLAANVFHLCVFGCPHIVPYSTNCLAGVNNSPSFFILKRVEFLQGHGVMIGAFPRCYQPGNSENMILSLYTVEDSSSV